MIEFSGSVNSSGGNSQGHYICDVKDKESSNWFRTNDNRSPVPMERKNISDLPYVVLYKRMVQ